MKIRFNPKEFLPKLRLVRNAVAVSKPTASLHNIKIVAKEIYFGAELQARNRELEIRVRVDCDVEQDGSVLVPANDFIDMLALEKEKPMVLERMDEGAMLKWDDEEYCTFLTESPDTFLDVSDFAAESYHEIPTEVMQELIRRTVFAAAKKSVSYALSGVCFDAEEESINAVAIDGLCMAWQRATGKVIGNPIIKSAVIPVKTLELLDRILKNKSFFHWDVVHMAMDEETVLFQGEDFVLSSPLYCGKYPQWKSYIPNMKETACATVNCGELYTAMESIQAAIKDAEKPEVALTFERDRLTLEAQKTKTEKMTLVIPMFFNGRAVVTINPAHLPRMLKLFDAGTNLSIHLSGDQPVMVKTADHFTYLVTPCSDIELDAEPEGKRAANAVPENKPIMATPKQKQQLLPTFTAKHVSKPKRTYKNR